MMIEEEIMKIMMIEEDITKIMMIEVEIMKIRDKNFKMTVQQAEMQLDILANEIGRCKEYRNDATLEQIDELNLEIKRVDLMRNQIMDLFWNEDGTFID